MASVNDFGGTDQSLAAPPLGGPGGWAEAVAAVVDNDDTTVDARVAAHAANPDPHAQYQRESERGQANGYAPLDGTGLVPLVNLPPTQSPSDHGALTGLEDNDHPQYLLPTEVLAGTNVTVDTVTTPGSVIVSATGGGGGGGLEGVFNVKDYGATGNGSTDDTSAIQAALTAGAGATVYIPGGVYRITSTLTVPANTTVTGVGTLHLTTTGDTAVQVNGSGVTVEGITITGPYSGTYGGGSYGIDVIGTSAASPWTNIRVRNVTISDFGYVGVNLKWVSGFEVRGCNVHDIGYTGIQLLSCIEGQVADNRVDNITPGSSGNMYGIALTYGGSYGALNPDTSDTVVTGNVVSNVAWEGIDTHGGLRLTISNNVILACRDSISINPTGSTSAMGISIVGNVIDNLSDTNLWSGSGFSIHVTGYSSSARAQGVTITGNTVRRAPTSTIQNTEGCVISGNSFDTCVGYGAIFLGDNNDRFTITGNAITDVWNTASWAAGITNTTTNNIGLIVGNSLVDGPKSATYINTYGLINNGDTGTDIVVLGNDFRAATTSGVAGSTGLKSGGFYTTVPVAKQSGVAMTAAGVHAALVTLGLISA